MYRVDAKKGNQTVCIYNDIYKTPETTAINPKLDLEEGTAGKFTVKLPQTNAGYDFIERLNTEIIIYRKNVEIWSGRLISYTEDFLKNKSLTCEGELAYLNDTTQPQEGYINKQPNVILRALLDIHNEKVSADKKFYVGVVSITDPEPEYYKYTDYESTLHEIKKLTIDKFGGFIKLRKSGSTRYIDILKDEDRTTSTQTIQFGSNLLDFTKSYDSTDFCTVLLPLGARLDSEYQEWEALDAYTTVYSVNHESIYVQNTDLVNSFGWIEKKVTWDDIEEPSELLTAAQKYLSEVQYDNLVLSVNAVDLSNLDVNVDDIHLSEKVRVVSKPHALDRFFTVSAISLPLDNPGNTSFTLGATEKTSISSKSVEGNTAIAQKIANIPTENRILNEARRETDALIKSCTTGYITITQRDNGSQEMYITNVKISDGYDPSDPAREASKYWVWNLNGLAFYNRDSISPSNPTGMKLGLDMLGRINADMLTVGTIGGGNTWWNLTTGQIYIQDLENAKSDIHTLTINEGLLDSKIESYNGNLSSRITQTNNSISTEITNRQNADSSLSSRITQNANSITTEITNRQNADNSLSSRISQTESEISTKVTAGQVSSMISQSASEIRLQATTISWDSTYSKMTSDGCMTVGDNSYGGGLWIQFKGGEILGGYASASRGKINFNGEVGSRKGIHIQANSVVFSTSAIATTEYEGDTFVYSGLDTEVIYKDEYDNQHTLKFLHGLLVARY